MYLIVGLGNPGAKYAGTRHNVGFEVAERLAERAATVFSDRKFKARLGKARISGQECLILQPQTYMNLSGESVGPALGFYKLKTSQLVVIHDEVDLPVGRIKLKKGGGHGGHNGLRSLIQHLPDENFSRVRIGVGRPPPQWDTADYVLGKFESADRKLIEEAVEKAADAVEAIVRDGMSRAMNEFNRAPEEEGAQKKKRRVEDNSRGEPASTRTGAGDNDGNHA